MRMSATLREPGFVALPILIGIGLVIYLISANWLNPLIYGAIALCLYLIRNPSKSFLQKLTLSILALVTAATVLLMGGGIWLVTAHGYLAINQSVMLQLWQQKAITTGILPALYPEYDPQELFSERHPLVIRLRTDSPWGHRLNKVSQGLAHIEAQLSEDGEKLTLNVSNMRPTHCPHIIQSLIMNGHVGLNYTALPIFFTQGATDVYDELASIRINGHAYFTEEDASEPLEMTFLEPFERFESHANAENMRPYCEHHEPGHFARATIQFGKLPVGGMNYMQVLIDQHIAERQEEELFAAADQKLAATERGDLSDDAWNRIRADIYMEAREEVMQRRFERRRARWAVNNGEQAPLPLIPELSAQPD